MYGGRTKSVGAGVGASRRRCVGAILDPHEDDGDVVDAALLVGQVDEALAQLFGRLAGVGRDVVADLLVGEHRRQPVGTEEERVALLELHLAQVGRHRRPSPEGPRHDVLERVRLGLFLGQDSGRHLLVDPRVVVRETRERSSAEEVRAAVAHVGEREDLFVEEAGDDGRAHPLQPRLRGDRGHHALVGLLDRDGQPVAVEVELVVVLEGPRRFFLLAGRGDELADRLDRDLGGDLACGVAAHAVGDDEEALGRVEGERILVVLALPPDVGQAERVDPGHSSLPPARALHADLFERLPGVARGGVPADRFLVRLFGLQEQTRLPEDRARVLQERAVVGLDRERRLDRLDRRSHVSGAGRGETEIVLRLDVSRIAADDDLEVAGGLRELAILVGRDALAEVVLRDGVGVAADPLGGREVEVVRLPAVGTASAR